MGQKVTDAVARLLGVPPAGLDDLVAATPPGAGGLVLVPHLDGERTPNRPEASGTLAGLRSDISREQLARAAVEGVVCNLLAGADHLPSSGGRILLVGGGSRSAAYRQAVADLAGQIVVVPNAEELVALGRRRASRGDPDRRQRPGRRNRMGPGCGQITETDPAVDGRASRAAYADVAADR